MHLWSSSEAESALKPCVNFEAWAEKEERERTKRIPERLRVRKLSHINLDHASSIEYPSDNPSLAHRPYITIFVKRRDTI